LISYQKEKFVMGKKQYPPSAKELVQGVEKLVSLPEVCFLVNDLVNDPLSELAEIGEIISQDPDLTARLLKLVNSSYYGFPKKIETVSRAILMVGLKELQHMVWSTTAVETFNNVAPNDANMATFWRHSIFTAVLSRILARETNVLHPERLFVSGLLHDVGQLLIFTKLPDFAQQIIDIQNEQPSTSQVAAEQTALGYDHGEIAGALFHDWEMPDSIVAAVKYHHDPQAAEDFHLEASIVHVADVMAHALEMGEEENMLQAGQPFAWERLGLPEARIKPVMHEAVMQFLESLELLLPGASQRI
jgi:HD-like signal output (HDOD) protein